MAVELATVLPGLLDTMVGNASEAWTPGTAPVALRNRFYRWKPRDFNAQAVPYTSAPSAAVMTATANAINAMGLANCLQEYERGDYYVDRTISPTGGSADTALAPKSVLFNDTTILAGGVIGNYQECMQQGTAGVGLAGLNDANDNLPVGETTRVLFDVTNTERSRYMGNLHLDGQSKAIALLAACNRHSQNGVGGVGSVWDNIRMMRARWGMFGTPLYGQARNFYPPVFVGNIFARVRVEGNVDMPFLFGGNTCDDSFMGELNVIQKAAVGGDAPTGRSYLFGAAIVCGTCYTNGLADTCVFLDLQKGHFMCKTMYAEKDFLVPIYARANSWIEGTLKYGAGNPSTFVKRAFVYSDDVSGGGFITSHQRSGDGEDIAAMVLIRPRATSKRNYWINQPYLESAALPFAIETGSGVTPSVNDKLISFTQDGMKKWTPGGTAAAPTLTPGVLV